MRHKTIPSRSPNRASRQTRQAEQGCRHAGMTRWHLCESMLWRRRPSPEAGKGRLKPHACFSNRWNFSRRYQLTSLATPSQLAPIQHRTATGLTLSDYQPAQSTRMQAQCCLAKVPAAAHFLLAKKGYQVFDLMWHTVCKRDNLELASRCQSCQARTTTGTQDNTSWMAGIY